MLCLGYGSFNFHAKLELGILSTRIVSIAGMETLLAAVVEVIIAVLQTKLKLHYWHIGSLSCFLPFSYWFSDLKDWLLWGSLLVRPFLHTAASIHWQVWLWVGKHLSLSLVSYRLIINCIWQLSTTTREAQKPDLPRRKTNGH